MSFKLSQIKSPASGDSLPGTMTAFCQKKLLAVTPDTQATDTGYKYYAGENYYYDGNADDQ
ncbi:MAG: hypothetical protein LBH87_02425 [Coriobacteriales bacterium]|nr:hypothetical protein [Coriobacteriales bacterium]